MILIRRILAVLIIPFLLVWFVASTVRSGLDQTVFDDSFMTDQLEEQDFYNWLHDDLIRVALDDMANVGVEVDSEFLPDGETTVEFADPATTRDEARALLRATFPPEYLEETASAALAEFMPYVRGESDEFAIPLALNERVSGFFTGVENTYVKIDFANILVDELITPAAVKSAEDFATGPFGMVFSGQQAGEAARDVAPPEWIDEQVFTTLDALDAYLSGQSDTLEIHISFKDRVPLAAEVVKRTLTESNADQVIFDTLIRPQIASTIGQVTLLSYQVTIEDEEITDAVNQIAPRDWVHGHINAIVDNVAAYMSRDTDTLEYTVDLTDQRDAAVDVVIDLAVSKVTGDIEALPACGSLAETQNAARAIATGALPGCTDPAFPLAQILEQLSDRLATEVKQTIGANFPASVTYDSTLFTDALSGQGATDLDGVRNKIAEGVTIDVDDVLTQLSDQEETAQRVLDIIRTGRPYGAEDLERYREEQIEATGKDPLKDADLFRGGLGIALGPVGAAIAGAGSLLLLFFIGMLAGRGWTSRLIWAASALAFVTLIVWIAFSQVLSGIGADFGEEILIDRIEDQIEVEKSQGDPTGMLELARDEGITKVRAVGDAVTGKFASYAFLWLAGGVIAILVGIALRVSSNRREKRYSATGYRYRAAQGETPRGESPAIEGHLDSIRGES